jgi:hypothetical protein
MLFLIALGAWVFVKAKEITSKETGSNPQSLMAGLQDKKMKLTGQIMETAKSITNLFPLIGDVQPFDRPHSPAKYNVNLLSTNGYLRERSDIVRELSNDLQRTGYNYIDYEVRLKDQSLPSVRIRVDQQSLSNFVALGNWPTFDLSGLVSRLEPLGHQLEIVESGISQLARSEKAREVEGLIGESSKGPRLISRFLFWCNSISRDLGP